MTQQVKNNLSTLYLLLPRDYINYDSIFYTKAYIRMAENERNAETGSYVYHSGANTEREVLQEYR